MNLGIVAFGYLGIDLVICFDLVVCLHDSLRIFKGAEMSEQSEALKERTMSFAITVLDIIDKLPDTPAGRVIAYQLAKCSTSVGANYRASCNGRSRAEFIGKLGTVVEEAEESVYWLEIVNRRKLVPGRDVPAAFQESIELRAIFSRSLGTGRTNARERHPPASMTKSMPK